MRIDVCSNSGGCESYPVGDETIDSAVDKLIEQGHRVERYGCIGGCAVVGEVIEVPVGFITNAMASDSGPIDYNDSDENRYVLVASGSNVELIALRDIS